MIAARQGRRLLDARHRGLQDDELVAAEAGDDVGLADMAAQPVGDRAQQQVAARMAERVVDLLELVEVDEKDGDRAGLVESRQRAGPSGRGGSSRLGRPVSAIVAGEVIDAGLGGVALGDVLDQNDRAAVFHRLEGEVRACAASASRT